eukprot:1067345-Heterocapsa_arctica.AAC.1
MWIAAAREREQAVACLVVAARRGARGAAQRVRAVDDAAAAADAAASVGRALRGAEPQADSVDVDIGLERVPRSRRERPQPLVAHAVVAQVANAPYVVVPAVSLGRDREKLGALAVDDGGDAALEPRHAARAGVLRVVGARL